MKAKGFSGAMIFDAGGAEQRGNRQVPAGPMFTTPAWRELFVHAVQEADRFGLELSLSIQSGWNLGGPDGHAGNGRQDAHLVGDPGPRAGGFPRQDASAPAQKATRLHFYPGHAPLPGSIPACKTRGR